MPQQSFRLTEALAPLITAALLLFVTVLAHSTAFYWALAAGTTLACLLARRAGIAWRNLWSAAVGGMKATWTAIFILILVGGLIGVWKASGTVPAMIYYGLELASPRYLVPAAFLLAVATSMMLGTTIGTLSTLGVAIMGMAQGLGAPLPLVAGALLAGALFGDRTSPLSASLNLNIAMTGVEMRKGISALLPTGITTIVVSLGLYVVLGLQTSATGAVAGSGLGEALAAHWAMGPWLLLPPVLVLVLAFLRVPVRWSLGVGMIAGIVITIINGAAADVPLRALLLGYTASTGDLSLDRMLSGGGIVPLAQQIAILLTAGAFSGIMESTGMMARVLNRLVEGARRPVALVGTTMLISTSVAAIAANQALAIIVTGRMLRPAYDRAGLSPYLLSRSIADSGTVLAPLIPWNVMGVLSAATLGIPVRGFAPYTLLALILPMVSLGWTWIDERRGPNGAGTPMTSVEAK